ncbi:hypothetical protein J4G37_45090, partial [Microvirga sp. 3-52]|nr:hypothetical protein [Microvirga sp. 3-52]
RLGRSYVAIYQDKELNSHLYFDFEMNEFFTIAERKSSGLVVITSFVAILFYAFMSKASLDIGLKPVSIVWICMVLGTIIGFISVKLTTNAINKGLKKRRKAVNPTGEQLNKYIQEGKKQFKTLVFIIIFILFFNLLTATLLLIMPESLLLMLSTIAMWAVFILVVWLIRPIKRTLVYKQ